MNKGLRKEIMTKTRIRNNKSEENKRKYSKQRDYCVLSLRNSKLEHFGILNQKKISNNKTFWKNIKPFLSDKATSTQKITLIKK